jgi:ribosome biogenesis GTPase
MTLYSLGLTPELEQYASTTFPNLKLGRVAAEHKERYKILTESGTLSAEITGSLRYAAESRADFPAVGDFVAFMPFDDSAIITGLLPRKTALARQAVGSKPDEQLIAANIDKAFLIQAADRDFNLNRLDRYMALCNAAGIEAIILLSKIDLLPETEFAKMLVQIQERFPKTQSLAFHNQNPEGFAAVLAHIEKGKTISVLGSSGVGKSTLLNNLLGKDLLETKEINEHIGRGRHTTTHRELFVLKDGGILIDTPGMREIALTDIGNSLDELFEDIAELIENCKFSNCSHHEKDLACAVQAALEAKELSAERWKQYGKMQREAARFSQSIAEKRKSDKDLGKMYREHIHGKRRF